VIEELFDGISQGTRLPETAEHVSKFREARDPSRTIDRPAQRAADERRARRAEARDALIRAAFFLDPNPQITRRQQNSFSARTLQILPYRDVAPLENGHEQHAGQEPADVRAKRDARSAVGRRKIADQLHGKP
jgi:hypothetical protein